MKRREFLGATTALGGALLLGAPNTLAAQSDAPKPEGVVTYYIEIRVPGPEKAAVLAAVNALKTTLGSVDGYLSLSFKQTIGESTMGRAYPNTKKGWLAQGFATLDGTPASKKVPFFYVMFVRFKTYDHLVASGIKEWFQEKVAPSLFAYNTAKTPPEKTSIALDYHEGIYTTVAAADRENSYMTPEEIETYLSSKQSDEVGNGWVSVNNHYMIMEHTRQKHYDLLRENLNGNTRSIFRPIEGDEGYVDQNDWAKNGQPGTAENTFFRKALTREILQSAFSDGDKRSYMMHGVWESIMDHENSHLDPRFAAGASKVSSYMIAMPVEPFYITLIQDRYVGQI